MFDFPQPQLGPGVRVDAAPPIGQVFPQPKLDDGRRLDDVTEGRFAVLADAGFVGSMPHELRATLVAAGITVVAAPSRGVDAWLAANKVRSVLIRPDAYVFATPNSLRRSVNRPLKSRPRVRYGGLNQQWEAKR